MIPTDNRSAIDWTHEFDSGGPQWSADIGWKEYCNVCDFTEKMHYRASMVAAQRQLALVYLWGLSLLMERLE